MKKLYRIKKNEEFQRILHIRHFVSLPNYTLYFATKRETIGRFGISVGKKLGGAVERNKIRRQIRMMIQEISDFKEEFDVVILVRSAYLSKSYAENKKDLENCLNKVRIKVRKNTQGELNEKAS